ncbi:carbohydrate ABC transporter permease [Enterocloster lavalensis]|uniref:Multiple sugar transport system permease protein n=1 Tax=Enterocloster lavalensis TaxID=460384 RepID=A0A1I0I908_9FIRM|nr:carbohydrate ABC transporter permease [Enterocloster lavalensis]MCB6342952.1 carbohydrate ABC transporter permease [Enterocloster lavalensis]SET92450.1 multiple sugar transport system permease protein [Enterocloster lavalensis]
MNSYRVKRNVKKFLFLLMVLLIIVTLMFPVAAMISVSLKKANDVFTMPVTWIPKVFAFENYVQVFRKMHILNGFKASLVITGMTIALIMVIAIPAAYAFSCLNFYCKKQMYYLVLVSQMFAPVIVIIPLYTMMNKMGLIDSWLSLVLMNTTFNLAFIVLMLKATFDGVPKEVVEAAKIDGCSPFMVMTRIFLPVSSTGIAVAVIFAFTRTWNEFLFAFTFISSTEKKPIIVSLYEILKNNPAVGIPWHYVMAGAMYTTVPLVILFICIRNYITGDHTAGAIK